MSRGVFVLSALFASLVVLAGGSALAASDSGAFSTVIQPNGKIVAAGWGEQGSQQVFGLARYTPNGSLDTSFGSRGKVTTPIGVDARAGAVALQPDGKIVTAGYPGSGPYNNSWAFALARYTPKGALDASFGTGGKVRTAFGSLASRADAVAIQANGRIVVVGTLLSKSKDAGFALASYRTDGALDTSFGTAGRVTTKFGSGGAASAVAIQPDGKIVTAGSDAGGFALARYKPTGALDTGFGGDGKVNTSVAACLVPKVKGQKLVHAKGALSRAHCATGKVSSVFSRTIKKRYVVTQKPKAGALRAEGAKVSLTVSKGKRP